MDDVSAAFVDFDNETYYQQSVETALSDKTLNFVVEFGRDDAAIAFDLGVKGLTQLLAQSPRPVERPVRWINIWAPNRQKDIINLLGTHYKFSPRLLAIIQTDPPRVHAKIKGAQKSPSTPRLMAKKIMHGKDDVETGAKSLNVPVDKSTPTSSKEPMKAMAVPDHYEIASQMVNYISIDVGPRFLCIGANWMHQLTDSVTLDAEAKPLEDCKERRVWSWIVLCDGNTVISLQEDIGHVRNTTHLQSIRSNTISVLSQISIIGHANASPISMQTVRQVLDDTTHSDPGKEGASNLFYYLFDDWRSVYMTMAKYRTALDHLQKVILVDMTRRMSATPDIKIIPRLHTLGRQIRQMQHLYAAYKNLISRILEPNSTAAGLTSRSQSTTTLSGNLARRVILAKSAAQRFERLGDRIKLLTLSESDEFLAEKDALISTYFNINAQKDSAATARLTRSATLLAKLSVLFLPVSLATAFFSTNIDAFQHYTPRDYWCTFAVIISISILSIFFFGKTLIFASEWLDDSVKNLIKKSKRGFRGLFRKNRGPPDDPRSDTQSDCDDDLNEKPIT